MLYRLLIFHLILPILTATTQHYRPKQCLRYRENDIFLDTCPAYFQDTTDFSVALFPDPVVLPNLSQPNHISATESTEHASSTPSENRSSQNDNAKPLMSFEEWQKKIKQNESDKDRSSRFRKKPNTEERQQMVDSIDGGFSDDFGAMLEGFMGSSKKSPNVYAEGEYISPSQSGKSSSRKPFTDVRIKSLKERFNYASIDCAATVRKANPEAKGAQSILYESKDQYLLNKCSANKFVILNLCEQIVVDTIVMANFEFFSSTFKDFRVYASSKYPTNEWKLLGQWQARNTRDLQVFKVPDSGFVEYLKIELLTHYGHEYYCPLSLVRVHGMTNMEYYTIVESQDQDPSVENDHLWPAEVREHIIQPEHGITNVSEAFHVKSEVEESEDEQPVIAPVNPTPLPTFDVPDIDFDFLKDTPTIESFIKGDNNEASEVEPSDDLDTIIPVASSTDEVQIEEYVTPTFSSMVQSTDSAIPSETSQILEPSSLSTSLSDFVISISPSQSEAPTDEATPDEETLKMEDSNVAENANTTSTTASSTAIQKLNSHTKESSNQESIYKTIMKRLNVLEQNMKLSQRFLDDQNKILNDVFVDMEKKHQDQLILLIGHLNETASLKIDHMERRYEQWYQDLKEQNENDSRDMNAKISILADQLSFERRLSISNFIIMISFFVYIALSRGTFSTLSPVVAAQQQERKRRESLSSRTKIALDSLIENRKNSVSKKPVVSDVPSKPIDLFLLMNKSKETKPKKPSNPRRHSDSPYHTMKNIDIHLPTSTAEKSGKPTISRQSSDSGRKSGQLSRNASNESIRVNNSLQSDVLYRKLDDLVVEQRHQETENPLRISKSLQSSRESLKSRESNESSPVP